MCKIINEPNDDISSSLTLLRVCWFHKIKFKLSLLLKRKIDTFTNIIIWLFMSVIFVLYFLIIFMVDLQVNKNLKNSYWDYLDCTQAAAGKIIGIKTSIEAQSLLPCLKSRDLEIDKVFQVEKITYVKVKHVKMVKEYFYPYKKN